MLMHIATNNDLQTERLYKSKSEVSTMVGWIINMIKAVLESM